MPWVALPFNERTLKQTLAEKFGVRGIPFLVGTIMYSTGFFEIEIYCLPNAYTVIDENGDIVDEAARTTVTSAQEAKGMITLFFSRLHDQFQ